jgi:putative ABC transport system permease protein
MIEEYIKMAYRNIKKRKLRTFLTLLGIVIAVMTIFVLISVSLGLQNAVEEQFRLLGTDKFFIQSRGQLAGPGTGGAVMLTKEDVDVIKKINGVKDVSFWSAAPAKIELSDEIRYTNVVGIDLDTIDLFIETGSYKAIEGRVLKKGDLGIVMIGSQYKFNNFLGKEVEVGDRILINDKQEFRVKGILSSVGNPPDDRLIYMNLDDFRVLFNIPKRIDAIVVQVDNEDDLRTISDSVERKLLKFRGLDEDTIDFTILTPEELLETIGVVLNIITAFLLGVAAISLVVGGIGIANTMYTSVLERTKEIGVMKSIGATNFTVLSIFLVESALLGIIGGIVGVGLGFGVSWLIEYIAVNQLGTTLLRTVTPFYLILGSLIFAAIVGSISGGLPAYRASRIIPVEALRYE